MNRRTIRRDIKIAENTSLAMINLPDYKHQRSALEMCLICIKTKFGNERSSLGNGRWKMRKIVNYYLNLGDRMTVFRCGWNRSWYLRTCIVKFRKIMINIENINSNNGLPLPCRPAPLPLYIEGVEKQRNLLGRLIGWSLKSKYLQSVGWLKKSK